VIEDLPDLAPIAAPLVTLAIGYFTGSLVYRRVKAAFDETVDLLTTGSSPRTWGTQEGRGCRSEQMLCQNSDKAFYPGAFRASPDPITFDQSDQVLAGRRRCESCTGRAAAPFPLGAETSTSARVSIGWTFGEFSKSKTPPCPQAWFSRAFAAMICFLFRASSPRMVALPEKRQERPTH